MHGGQTLSGLGAPSGRAGVAVAACALLLLALLLTPRGQADDVWRSSPEVIAASEDAVGTMIRGVVFEDLDGDGRRQPEEPGIAGVLVSNGVAVVATDAQGAYELPVLDDMNLTVVQPGGWQVPVDHRQVPQFFHVHKRDGSPAEFRYGGLPASGTPPARVNFPLRRYAVAEDFNCAVIGDSQTYSNTEVGYFRDSSVVDLLAAGPGAWQCLLYVGDVVGDDLDLLDRLLEIGATVGAPQWLVHGNHDYDFDASSDEDSADSWRRLYGPEYYAFEMGQVLFVVLDNVVYPCNAEDMAVAGREFCGDAERPRYNGRVTDRQMQWLKNLLSHVPDDRLIVVATHIPLVSFMDPTTVPHQTDNVAALYALLEGREALSLSGHTHTLENHAPGQSFDGWRETVGVERLPFRHIVAGASSGSWWQGDFDIDGIPMALQRMGAPKGLLTLGFSGSEYRERYLAARLDPARVQWVGFNTPDFREWFDTIVAWARSDAAARDPVPPLSINDLADTRMFTPEELAEGVWLTANVWLGSAETRVTATLNDGEPMVLERSQAGEGEGVRIGAEWADPFAAQRQLSVARYAIESRSGEARNQGFEVFRGSSFGPAAPQPMRSLADRNMHLWRLRLPETLPEGTHRLRLETVDRHGERTLETVVFEVRSERPPARWRHELWD